MKTMYLTKTFALAALLAAPSAVFAAERIGDQTRFISESDRDMNAAIDEARRTLDRFLALARNPPAGAKGFKLKVMLSDANGTEHFWFTPFRETQDGFAGVLANTPSTVKSFAAGEVYAFKRGQISDWGYELNGKQIGSYTVCALFKTMPKDEVARYKSDYGFVCEN
jgi:uncharacterized protein YegJ (DUF2314 family)